MKKYIFIALLAVLAIACSEDKGNYDYKIIDKITLERFYSAEGLSGDDPNPNMLTTEFDTVYNFRDGNNVYLKPLIKIKDKDNNIVVVDENNINQYGSCAWVLNYDTISTDFILNQKVKLNVTHKKAMQFIFESHKGDRLSYGFDIKISLIYGNGYYMLSKDEENNAYFSFRSTAYPEASLIMTDEYQGIQLGKNPVAIGFVRTGFFSGKTYMITQYSEVPYWGINPDDMTYSQKITSESYADNVPREFDPSAYASRSVNEFFISNGQLVTSKSGLIFRPTYKLDFDLDSWIGINYNFSLRDKGTVTCYDKDNCRFVKLYKTVANAETGTAPETQTFNNVALPTGMESIDMSGQTIVASDILTFPDTKNKENMYVVTKDESNLHFYVLKFDADKGFPFVPEIAKIGELPYSGTVSACFSNSAHSWYISMNNKIYTCGVDGDISMVEYYTIPEKYGEIVKIKNANKALIIMTYNDQLNNENKGGLILYSIEDSVIKEEYENVMKYPVDLHKID